MTYTHLRDFVLFLVLSVTYIPLGGILLISQFLVFKLLGLRTLSHWLNSSFIAVKNEYNCSVTSIGGTSSSARCSMVAKSLLVYVLQVITTLSRVMDESVGSFPSWTEFPLGQIFGCWGDFA